MHYINVSAYNSQVTCTDCIFYQQKNAGLNEGTHIQKLLVLKNIMDNDKFVTLSSININVLGVVKVGMCSLNSSLLVSFV